MLTHPDATPTAHFHAESRLAYLQAGSGPVLLLLHGWGAFKELWWSTMVALARDGFSGVAPDMPGHGESPLAGDTAMRDVAERITALCEGLELGAITLVGHSMGGNVAVELAHARPDLVRRLVLVDAAIDPQGLPTYTRSYLQATSGWAAFRLSQMVERQWLGRLGQQIPHLHGGGLVRPWLRRSAYLAQHDVEDMRRLLAGLFNNPIGDRLAQVSVPTLVMTGEFDTLVPVSQARAVARRIPGAQLAVIRGAAHNPMDERPRAFERRLLEFLHES